MNDNILNLDFKTLSSLLSQRMNFSYQFNFATAVHGGASQTASVTIERDSDFLWIAGAYYATIANAAFTENTRVIPSVNVQIQNTSSGRYLMSAPVPIPSLFGTGQRLAYLPEPLLFQSTAQITCSITNFDAAVDYNISLTMLGAKLYNV